MGELGPGLPTRRLASGKAAARRMGQGSVPTEINPDRVGVESLEHGEGPGRPARIAHYEVLREIGSGGMGTVYAARDPRLGRRVAIKLMSDADPEFAARFLLEARSTARCSHENIVVIHEVNEADGYPFMVLQYLEGQTLAEVASATRLPESRAVEYMVPVVRALEHAHAAGIVHRDLKPENIMITDAGVVKVLDFGIARAFDGPGRRSARITGQHPAAVDGAGDAPSGRLTNAGRTVGTPPYMSPEQLRGEEVDGRADVWSVGVLLYQMLAGHHPMGPGVTAAELREMSRRFSGGLPSLADAVPAASTAMVTLVDRCLRIDRRERFADAGELRRALEALVRGARGSELAVDECPYPGLGAFAVDEDDRFFGRDADVRRVRARLADEPIVALVGPSGVGKSSLLRAGVASALQHSGEPWEVLSLRPGRDGLGRMAALATELQADAGPVFAPMADQLRAEPGRLGALLRSRAARSGRAVLLYVDQLEELYTLTPAPEDRRSFTACLRAAADDPQSPVRVVVTMRSDFLDRASEDKAFLEALTRGLVFVVPMDRAGLRDALVRPASLAGYRFEDDDLVEEMLDQLESAASPLPLLQFAASKLWDSRDRESRTLTAAAYRDMGGLAGALATHADQVVNELPRAERDDVRRMFQRLVTVERTRAVVPRDELLDIAGDPESARRLIDALVSARLLVVRTDGAEPTVEIVHESLVTRWPTLAQWLAEADEDLRFAEQLRTTARQWHERGRPVGLLWRDTALDEARQWRRRNPDRKLPARERDYLDAVFALHEGARRRRRQRLVVGFAGLAAVAVAAVVALFLIGRAERSARVAAERARDEAERALALQRQADAERDRAARERERAQRERDQRRAAEDTARSASALVVETEEDLRQSNERLQVALEDQQQAARRAEAARARAEREADRAGTAEAALRARSVELERLLRDKERQVRELEAQRRKISTELR